MHGDAAAAPRRPLPLQVLCQRLREARDEVERHRGEPASSPGISAARHDLARALEEYANALEMHGLPVPHSLQTELRLHRRLFD